MMLLLMALAVVAPYGTLFQEEAAGCPSDLGRGRATGRKGEWSKAGLDLYPGPDVGEEAP